MNSWPCFDVALAFDSAPALLIRMSKRRLLAGSCLAHFCTTSALNGERKTHIGKSPYAVVVGRVDAPDLDLRLGHGLEDLLARGLRFLLCGVSPTVLA